jgi:hypothetical protein
MYLYFYTFQILESQALWGLHFVHTMLTDMGEQYNHDLIHMVILLQAIDCSQGSSKSTNSK